MNVYLCVLLCMWYVLQLHWHTNNRRLWYYRQRFSSIQQWRFHLMEMITFYGGQSAEFLYSNLHIFTLIHAHAHNHTPILIEEIVQRLFHFFGISLTLSLTRSNVFYTHTIIISSRWTFNMCALNSIEYNLIIIWTRSNYST